MNTRNSDKNQGIDLLPGVITSITPQKKRKNRYSIFVDGEFLIGVSESVLLNHNLDKGRQLDKSEFQAIAAAEERQKAREYLLNLLSRRDHTRKELLQKAYKKQLDNQVVHNLLDEFEENGWIDHTSFTRSFIRDKFRINRWGPRKIISSLQQKGIDRNLAEKLTDEYFETIELLDIFQKLVDKKSYKFRKVENPLKRRKKVFDYLARKGYHTNQILQHIDLLMESVKP